ncbi:alpha/beta hydrolase [Cryobacterium psychrophilum]|uniref:Phospholipase n=1 Tax=Cryobacterium psychrophilum TaxID=41988 RepID=A0A4Y8KRG1_9MICO|nr:alpha/beta hydrolase-fold protein [Cryobacterium psychrophilum]TDW29765.1 phospholipase/carboxylesterase [Cryobacterium psychrophilum]TFD81865.1 phospholipase [Cryobacterium psychrophilum]
MDNHNVAPIDTNAVLWSAAGAERVGRPLLLILHGYGSHEGDLFSLAPHLPLEPVIAALRAPLPVGDGWSWFPITDPSRPATVVESAVDAATTAVLDWLDNLAEPPASVGLLGFSQGGAMALQLLRRAPDRFTFAVQLSGFVSTGDSTGDERLAERRPPVFWGRGTADPVIPTAAVDRTQAWLPGHSTLTERIYEGMGHSVSQAELGDVVSFLREQY